MDQNVTLKQGAVMPKIFIVDIEAVDTRYTKQWKEHLPRQLQQATNKEVVVISGGETPQATTPGAFLNFGGTNVYKSNQLQQIGEMVCNGMVRDGDYFLYTDAWNPTVIQLRYMAELLGISIQIGGLWHAGSYDPQDFLGRLIGDKPWVRNAERSMYDCYNHNFFASDFHINMFAKALGSPDVTTKWWSDKQKKSGKIVRCGWPMEYMHNALDDYKSLTKRDLILFPHRIAPEKQIDIFKDLASILPQYEFVVCQEQELTKHEYHTMLGEAKLVFSANLQETLGISWYEGALVGAIPMVPDRLSYKEMAVPDFKYPSEWTKDFNSYTVHREEVADRIVYIMEHYEDFLSALHKQVDLLEQKFFSGTRLYNELCKD